MAIHEVFPYLCVRDTAAAIEFYQSAFGVREKFRLTEPGGRVGHAELDFDGATLMLSDEYPEMGVKSAETLGATPVTIHLHVDDADALGPVHTNTGDALARFVDGCAKDGAVNAEALTSRPTKQTPQSEPTRREG